jgi:hypothetical protein
MMDPKTGQLTGITKSWRRFRLGGAEEMVRTGQLEGRELFIPTRQVSQALHAAREANRPKPELVADVTKHAGGRTPKHDWEGMTIEIARLDAESGIANKSQADIVRYLQDWFQANGAPEAPLSSIKERVKRYQDALQPKTRG